MNNTKIIQCMKCIHYQVTYNPQRPRGCKLYGIESNAMPYIAVKEATGSNCTEFSAKVPKDASDGKTDYNDQKYWK